MGGGAVRVGRGIAAIAVALASALGCAPRPAITAAEAQAILERHADGVLAVATTLPNGTRSLCSGALVAKNVLLTARHCISQALTTTPLCTPNGLSRTGAQLEADIDPRAIAVYEGTHVRVARDEPLARVLRSVRPESNVLCDADIALLVLDRELEGVPVLPMRLDQPVRKGDVVVPIGYGGGFTQRIGLRVPRGRSTVLALGPLTNADSGAVLGPREFEVDRATCRGDSGGPALDARTGEIVGVVSRGGSCVANGNHIYTRLDAFAHLVDVALILGEQDLRWQYAQAEQARRGAPRDGARTP